MWESDADLLARVDKDKMPRHVAIIMDGNGRWANCRGLMRSAGHTAGVKTLKSILKTAVNLKLEALTVYAFSTENWKRPPSEVDFLMHLFSEYLEREKLEMHANNVRIKFLGRTEEFAPSLQKLIRDSVELMKNNTGVKFNVAADYGGQDEIIRAAQKLAGRVKRGELSPEDISAKLFEEELDTAGQPPVDLMIRTSGDLRVSNFLLWQAAYAEFWFTDTPWPEFTPEEFIDALIDFGKRSRRFGALNN
ncbi:MAG: di-trans,poly-cis-decaprenylcistransferase [Selenomonadaceae bacterium]|nr:di-trans,poly-cis-decaprenylcistransferase [Selenomonadaceae bacterium]